MERDKFIEMFETSSSVFDMDRTKAVMQGCLYRQKGQDPKLRDKDLTVYVMEECAELIEAVSRMFRGRDKDNYGILEETADVLIDIFALMMIYGISEEDIIKAVNAKLDREIGRIKEFDPDYEIPRIQNAAGSERMVTIVMKDQDDMGTVNYSMTVRTALNKDELLNAIRLASYDYLLTEEGKAAWIANDKDFTYKDFINCLGNKQCGSYGFTVCDTWMDTVEVDLDEQLAAPDEELFYIETMTGNVYVSDDDIDDIMSTVISGCTHWCSYISPADGISHDMPVYQLLSRNIDLRFELFEDQPAILTLEKFKTGIRMFLVEYLESAYSDTIYQALERRIDNNRINPGMIDTNDADVIVQLALFGEVVYS